MDIPTQLALQSQATRLAGRVPVGGERTVGAIVRYLFAIAGIVEAYLVTSWNEAHPHRLTD